MKNKRTVAIWGTLCSLLLLAGGGIWWLERDDTPIPVPKVAITPTKPEQMATPAPPSTPVPVSPLPVLTAGNLGELTGLKEQVEKLKLEVTVKELEAKKDSFSAVPPVQTAPKVEMTLPDLLLQPAPPPKAVLPVTPVVVSVQGLDGDVQAVIRARNGKLVTLRQGASFDGGVVTDITRSAVLIRRKNITTPLAFE